MISFSHSICCLSCALSHSGYEHIIWKTVHIICDMRSFLFFFLVFFPSICFVLLFKVSCFISVSSVFSWYFYSGVYFFFNLWTVDKTRLHLFHETTLAFIYSVFGWDPAIFFSLSPFAFAVWTKVPRI